MISRQGPISVILAIQWISVASIMTCSIPRAAFADPDDFAGAEQMVVSASRSPRSQASVPSFSSVLEGADLERSVSVSVSDALRFVPGLHVVQDGARGGRAALYLRGLDPNHVVVLIDGVRLNDAANQHGGAFDPTTLAIVDIDRIEVIRGPLSSVYGSDALAGVINVITKKVAPDAEPHASITGRGGRFHTGSVAAHASSGIAGLAGLSIGAGYDTTEDPNSSGDYEGFSWKAKLDAELPMAVDFEAFTRMHWSSARSFPSSSGGPELAGIRELEDRDVREILFGTSFKRALGEDADVALRMSYASRREDIDSPGIDPEPQNPFNFPVVPESTSGDEYKRWDVGLSASKRFPDFDIADVALGTRLIAGIDYVNEDGESDTFIDFGGGPVPAAFFDTRETWGIFAEIEESLGDYVVLSGSLRYDATPDAVDRLTPGGGITIDIPNTTFTVYGNYGVGFKRPSFYALENPLVGNSSLDVEESLGWEIGVRGATEDGRLRGQISYFDIEVKDLIDFDASTFQLVNRDRLISRGVEIEVDWQAFEWLSTRSSVTFNPTDFEGTSLQPENRPRWKGFSELRATPIERVGVALRVLAVGSVEASSFHTGDRKLTLSGYERLDLRVDWQPAEWVDLFFEIENLTDRTYREAVGFESPGIAPRVGLTLRM